MVSGEASALSDRMSLILSLESVGNDVFEGATLGPAGQSRLFGGHILGQALLAAYGTVAARRVYVLHAQFLSPGLPGPAIRYHVERVRDGRSFSVRQLAAIQNGRRLFTMSASFHTAEPGVEHQDGSPVAAAPSASARGEFTKWGGVETLDEPVPDTGGQARRQFWFRMPPGLVRDIATSDAAIAYASDLLVGTTPLLRHDQEWSHERNASLDHSVWFHRPADPRRWTLFDQYSPTAAAGRGFTRGEMLGADGALFASVAQESLLRT